ncbi:MAG: 3-isopropylmalate dehydratase small subunit [Proteobacteria bacterium]|nr:3-isopropylmalate dehydratase small subunit [Pseudomonadota bacterium]
MEQLIKGKVWKFEHNVDTDVLAPWKSIDAPWEERKKDILPTRPGFVDQVQTGDVIVAGRNWGCGSSREQAVNNVKHMGLSAVLAESFGRIFFRNAIAVALPVVVCPGIHQAFEEGDQLELEMSTCRIRNLTRNTELQGQPYTAEMLAIIEKGGLMNQLKERLANQ